MFEFTCYYHGNCIFYAEMVGVYKLPLLEENNVFSCYYQIFLVDVEKVIYEHCYPFLTNNFIV